MEEKIETLAKWLMARTLHNEEVSTCRDLDVRLQGWAEGASNEDKLVICKMRALGLVELK